MISRNIIASAIAGAAFSMATPAQAQQAPDQYDKCYNYQTGLYAGSCAAASGIGGGADAQANIGNGHDAPTNFQHGSNVVSTSWSENGWANSASFSNSISSMTTSSNLADGTLHAYAVTGAEGGDVISSSQSFSMARISDVITFNNTSGAALNLGVGYTYDGQFIGSFGNGAWFDSATILFALGSPDNSIVYANSGQRIFGTEQTDMDASGVFNHRPDFGGTAADFSYSAFGTPGNGLFGGGTSTFISIPTGTSQLGFSLTLAMQCRVANTICDFANTSTFAFASLPTGLSYTSDSGVLFSALNQGAGAVPEPATWAMMLLGFGLLGAAQRSRSVGRITASI
jgi:hypothetical protein